MKKQLLIATIAVFGFSSQKTVAQTIDVDGEAAPLEHYWSVGTCAGRVNEGLRIGWMEQLQLAKDNCGYRYVRMHDLFNDDMCIYFLDSKGNVTYNWQYVDEVYDRLLDMGIRPFVELSFFPTGVARDNSRRNMWYRSNTSYDPERLPRWHDLVEAFARHCVERYGLDEVREWYFEVWNEPNLNMGEKGGFADFGKADYFQIYKASAEAVKSVDASLRIGGPATSNFIADERHEGDILDNSKSRFYPQEEINKQQWKGIWIEEFLDFCRQTQTPVDFVSCHTYPTDYALDPVSGRGRDAIRYANSVKDDFNWLRKTISESAFPQAEIHITEWSTSPNSRDRMHDLLPPAAYIVRVNLDCVGMVNSLMYWTFTDIFEEKGGGQEIFHGGFGQLNFQGIPKPSFHAYRMLNALGDEMVSYQNPIAVSRHSDTGKITAIAFNYPEEFESHVPATRDAGSFMESSDRQLSCTLKGLSPNAEFSVEVLDYDHGNAYVAWQQMGKPHSPNREQTAQLKEAGWATAKSALKVDDKGRLKIEMTLTPWSVVLIDQK